MSDYVKQLRSEASHYFARYDDRITELERDLADANARTGTWRAKYNEGTDRITELEATLAAIDALHKPVDFHCATLCAECLDKWPCPTHRLLHPEEGPT